MKYLKRISFCIALILLTVFDFLFNSFIARSKGVGNQNYNDDNHFSELIHEVELPRSGNLQEKGRWCHNNIGPMANLWDIKTEGVSTKLDIFVFQDETDAMAFKLAWS